ncbi:MAG: glycosyltransferase [Ardenticatenaceae bacterium]|nr:glycosyltransferase [Ardenticatenaceae bacterium]MCB8989256.1 glycosyltransferase [Ardenticatenaceae bacterium]
MPKDRLHIAHFTNTYLPVMSGVVRSVTAFRQAQVDLGHNVFIFAQDAPKYKDDEPFIFRYPALNIPVRNYPVTIPVSPLIDWVLPIIKPDVIHAHHPAPMGTAASDKADKLGVPLVFTHHTRYQDYTQYMGLPEELVNDILTRLLADYMQKCQHILAPSASIKQMIQETYGISERVTVVPTGIDLTPYQNADGTAVRRRRGWGDNETVLISVGRLVEEKNFRLLLEAVHIVMQRHKDVRLALIGDGPEQKELEKLCQQWGIAKRVEFVGRVPFEEMPAHLKAADIFCFASITETQGLVTLEAMAAGLPVTAVDATGTSDIVIHEENGLLTANDAQALAAAIERVLDDEALAAQLREGATETAVSYEIHAVTEKLVGVYQQAIADKQAGQYVKADKHKPIFGIDWDKLFEGLKGIEDPRQV